jgi:hypothetical protein
MFQSFFFVFLMKGPILGFAFASLSSLVSYLQVRQGANPRPENLKDAPLEYALTLLANFKIG